MPSTDIRVVDERIGDVLVHATVRGDGPSLLLLHGYPETHVMWNSVAPLLAERFTVVTSDLRGYGDSGKPAPLPDHSVYSKHAMAADQLGLMRALGFERFGVAGHDRGGRVAHRMALDAPASVSRLAVLDVVPTLHMFENVDRAMATSYFHWFFLALENGLPEQLIGADPDAWLRSRFTGRHAGGRALEESSYAEYRRCFCTPEAIAASCADYRSAATVDLEHDRADRAAGHRVDAPLLALWGSQSYVGRNFDVPAVWAEYATGIESRALHADHYLAEEQPEQTAAALLEFFAAEAGR